MFQLSIELTTYKEMVEFVKIASTESGKLLIKSGEYVGNAKSLLSVMSTIEWDDVTLVSETDLGAKFNKFIKNGRMD